MAWSDVRRVIISHGQIKLSPLAEATRLDPFRGVLLRPVGDNSETVLAYIRQHVPDSASVEDLTQRLSNHE
jgi:hypothetical protein